MITNFKGVDYNHAGNEGWFDDFHNSPAYFEKAIRVSDGQECHIVWYTTEEYEKSCALAQLESELADSHRSELEIAQIEEEIMTLEAEGITSFFCEDGSNACDWDSGPDYVYTV